MALSYMPLFQLHSLALHELIHNVYTCIKYINYLFLDVFSIVNDVGGGVARCVTSTLTNYTVTISALVSNVLTVCHCS